MKLKVTSHLNREGTMRTWTAQYVDERGVHQKGIWISPSWYALRAIFLDQRENQGEGWAVVNG